MVICTQIDTHKNIDEELEIQYRIFENPNTTRTSKYHALSEIKKLREQRKTKND